ncbi:MAG TPA: dihydrolipoamide acetyltransferase family protein, partial [Candidatus Limnocylindria bacterium]|nr:dihydrolipoamide acetyltransferase family protein [Candidatus Limnocylindria bacterium]
QAAPSIVPVSAAVATAGDGERVRSSPAARKRAQELGVDINAVRGTGPGGRINIEDVEAAASAPPVPTPSGNGATAMREPLTRMRRAVAEAMTRSVREAPQFSISVDVDMSAADAKRRAAGVSYTDVIIAAAAAALRGHPRLRSRYDGDAVATSERIDVGIAVALDAGLIVPVIREADRKPLAAIRAEREALEAAVRAGHARSDAFGDACITVSNLGTFGVDRFTAIVNPPEASILAVGRVADRVVAANGAPAVRPMVTLTLTVDHRVADGADAARYLADVAKALQT